VEFPVRIKCLFYARKKRSVDGTKPEQLHAFSIANSLWISLTLNALASPCSAIGHGTFRRTVYTRANCWQPRRFFFSAGWLTFNVQVRVSFSKNSFRFSRHQLTEWCLLFVNVVRMTGTIQTKTLYHWLPFEKSNIGQSMHGNSLIHAKSKHMKHHYQPRPVLWWLVNNKHLIFAQKRNRTLWNGINMLHFFRSLKRLAVRLFMSLTIC